MDGCDVLERLSWAVVTRVESGRTSVRRYDIQYPRLPPYEGSHQLEAEAFADLATVVARPIDEPMLRRWIKVGTDDGASWAMEEDFDGMDVNTAWALAARMRPHEIELAWRPQGAMAGAMYAVNTIDRQGRVTKRMRQGPCELDEPIDYPSARKHHAVRVRQTPIAPRLAARVVVDAGRAVARLHAVGLVHGMLTTEAIALRCGGRVVVHRIGTYKSRLRGAAYMGSGWPGRFHADLAPELVAEDFDHTLTTAPDVTTASDVFQLASSLYELLAFSPPWMRATSFDTIQALRSEMPVPISAIHRDAAPLDAILATALARDAGARPTLAEFVAAVDAAFPADPDDAQELARILADAARADPQAASSRDVPM